MSDNYEGKDGLARDLAKLKYEEKAIYRALKDSAISRFNENPSFHNFTNLLVEAARISPYYIGHVAVISLGINCFFLGVLISVSFGK
tara:strand:- start:381 stop:641 length:261 start_codon:yes stop_codon:yes gene_type:complete